jgi:hypothetical protein
MIEHQKVQREELEAVKITCNKCGVSYDIYHGIYPTETDFTTIKNIYGYGSKKDGAKYESHICESCMDTFYATFKIPPTIISPGDEVINECERA